MDERGILDEQMAQEMHTTGRDLGPVRLAPDGARGQGVAVADGGEDGGLFTLTIKISTISIRFI